jgi:hypothetical protein
MIRIIQTLAQNRHGVATRRGIVVAPAVLSMPLIKVYFSIRWLTGRGYVERGRDIYRLTRRGWGVALFHLAKNHKQRFRENAPGAKKWVPAAMNAARMEYAADLFGMTDQDIEREIKDAEETINDAESWLEALIAEKEHRK